MSSFKRIAEVVENPCFIQYTCLENDIYLFDFNVDVERRMLDELDSFIMKTQKNWRKQKK